MKLYGVTQPQLEAVMRKVSRKQYKGNLEFVYLEAHRNHVQFTLRVKNSHGTKAQGSGIVAGTWLVLAGTRIVT